LERGRWETSLGSYSDATRYYDAHPITQVPLRSREGVILWRTFMGGGSTAVSCGNAVRSLEGELAALGMELEEEFAEAEAELGVAPLAETLLSDGSRRLRDAAHALGYELEPMPKFIDETRCARCGACTLGCPHGARWSAVEYLEEAQRAGAEVGFETEVREVLVRAGRARGALARGPKGDEEVAAETVILAAGGLATPVILQASDVEAGEGLFVDLMVNVYGITEGVNQIREPQMALVNTEFHGSHGFLLSPFVNHSRRVRFLEAGPRGFALPTRRLLGLMVKTKDEASGRVLADGSVSKEVTPADRERIERGVAVAREILVEAGVDPESILVSKPQGAHPGGTAAIGRVVDANLRTEEVEGLYVCDAAVLPEAPGAPPILTLVALAKRLAQHLVGG
jgi:choline dehydrogenase-like flavoprotein